MLYDEAVATGSSIERWRPRILIPIQVQKTLLLNPGNKAVKRWKKINKKLIYFINQSRLIILQVTKDLMAGRQAIIEHVCAKPKTKQQHRWSKKTTFVPS